MSSIGGFEFLEMTGQQIPVKSDRIAVIDRPGTDGVAFRIDALKAMEVTITTIEGINNLTDANLAVDDYQDLKGTLVTIIDDNFRWVTDVMILDVQVDKVNPVINSVPVGINYLVTARWIVKAT